MCRMKEKNGVIPAHLAGKREGVKSADIGDWRNKIDGLDAQILSLLGERAKYALEIGKIKSHGGISVLDPKREAEIISRLKSLNSVLPEKSLEAIYREIFSAARAIEKNITVAFLGPAGTFSNEAAIQYFGSSCDLNPCPGFEAVFNEVDKGLADYGVLPIENSIEGSVHLSLDLLRDSRLNIFAEKTISAHQYLVSKLDNKKSAKRLYSHIQPLGQCKKFLTANLPGIEIHETFSTAAAAEKAANDLDSVAICSLTAARLNSLTVLHERIEDFPNFTRFMVLSKQTMAPTGKDKTSIAVTLKNKPGELYRLLGVFYKGKINLTKIYSRPIPGSNWGYLFYIDFEGHKDDKKTSAVLKAVAKIGESLKILGSYPREK
jgi:chorismate mutase/prephenate dehydratase